MRNLLMINLTTSALLGLAFLGNNTNNNTLFSQGKLELHKVIFIQALLK